MKAKVLITGNIPREWLGELEVLADVTIWEAEKDFLMPRLQLLDQISYYDAVVNFAEIKADAELIEKAVKLQIIANASIGSDKLDLPLLTLNKIWASNAPGYFNYPVAEYVFTGILALSRKIWEADHFVRQGKWQAFEPGRWDGISLKDQTLGIIGYGTIGKALKGMAEAIGSKVIHYSPHSGSEAGWRPFEELIRSADIISVHVPLTAQTEKLIDSAAFHNMKAGAIFVNTSRGRVVDQKALLSALLSGKLGGAVLDVFEHEPLVPEQLKKLRNVILTPHMAGGTKMAREACLRRAINNVIEVLRGNPPLNPLNKLLHDH